MSLLFAYIKLAKKKTEAKQFRSSKSHLDLGDSRWYVCYGAVASIVANTDVT